MEFTSYIRAAFPIIWVETHEEDRAIEALSNQLDALDRGFQFDSWDCVTGFNSMRDSKDKVSNPVRALQKLPQLPDNTLLFFKDAHKFMNNIEFVRTIKSLIPKMKSTHRHLILIGPVVDIPIELSKDISIIDFSLPTLPELTAIADKIINSTEELKGLEIDPQAIKAIKGLTYNEAENSISACLIEHRKLDKATLESQKLQTIRKSGLMEICEPIPLDQLGGMKNLIKYMENRLSGFTDTAKPTPKGILLVGLPGGGKSLSAKVIASILDFPLIRLDIAALKSKHVGSSEANTREATRLIDAIGESVIWLDEIEKAIGGAQSSNRTDGGTTSAMLGHIFTWMIESEEPHYLVATCNDIAELLAISQGAFIRSGRFDDIFFVDLPGSEDRKEILKIMNKRYNTKIPLKTAEILENHTGAEIEKIVKSSIFDGLEESIKNTHPIFDQNREVIETARTWASKNARLANTTLKQATWKTKDEGRKLDL